MLLYDQIIEHADRLLRQIGPQRFGDNNLLNLELMRIAPAYEISDVMPLLGDWFRDKDKAVPKRPPHDFTWAEWKYHDRTADGKYGDEWTLGVLIAPLSDERRAEFAAVSPLDGAPDGQMSAADFMNQDKDFYVVQMFKRLDAFCLDPEGSAKYDGRMLSYEERRQANVEQLNQPACDLGTFVWSQKPDGSEVHRFKFIPCNDPKDNAGTFAFRATLFFLPVMGSFAKKSHWQPADPWPPFMAFALLHCKNVVTEDHVPDANIQRKCAKHNRPPRVTYKTLKIEVPKSVLARGSYDGHADDAGPQVRFHLCSGHFRELRSEKFTNKKGQWVWVPAHWRGSMELGQVHKKYQLEAPLNLQE